MNKIAKFILKIIISAGFVGWLIFKINWLEVLYYLSEVKSWQIALYMSVIIIGMMISAYKWKLLTDHKRLHFSFAELFKLYLTGSFINNFMPSFIGGDTYRAYQVGKTDKKYTEAASTVMMDRITGFIGGSILTFVFALFNWDNIFKSNILIGFYVLLLCSFGFDIFLARLRHSEYLHHKLGKYVPEKIKSFLKELGGYNNHSKIISRTTAWGAIFAFVGVAIPNYILFRSLGINIDIMDYLSTIFIISIISVIPISINNIGLKEWAYVTFFGIYGINSSLVVSVAILGRFLQMIISFFALPFYLQNKSK